MTKNFSYQLLGENIGRHPVFLFDFDGTLAEIALTPDEVNFKPFTKYLIEKIAGSLPVGIISGRMLGELKKLVGINGIYYSGNHGIEIEGPGLHFIEPASSESINLMAELLKELRHKLSLYKCLIEDKKYSISIHYRTIDPKRVNDLLFDVSRILEKPLNRKEIKILNGKKVVEVKPPVEWNKGKGVEIIMRHLKNVDTPVFFGDDLTDEDAFETVNLLNGVSALIGNERSSTKAKFKLGSTHELAGLLARFISENLE